MGCMHALRVGRDASRLRERADAAGVRAGRDCRAQPHVAAAGDQRDRGGSGLAGRQLRGRADGGLAGRAEPAVRRRVGAALLSGAISDAGGGQRFCRGARVERAQGARRERPDLSARFVAELQSVAEAGEDHGADDVDQFRRRFHQSAQPAVPAAGGEADEECPFPADPRKAETHGHGTHTWAKFWKADLSALLARSE